MPSLDELRQKKTFELYSCEEFAITGVLYPKNKLFLHLDWPSRRFTPSIYKKGLLAMAQIKRAARENGIPALYVLVPEELTKWEQMFGFGLSERWLTKDGKTVLHLMKQATN